MSDAHQMTDKLKKLETVIHDKKVDLNAINIKLQSAYDYEEELIARMKWAKENTEKLRLEFTQKAQSISKDYTSMKNIMDVFTGNFYKS